MLEKYILKNKDKELVLFSIQDGFIEPEITEIQRYSDIGLPPEYTDISSWIENRNYAKHKEHLKKWLKEWNIDNAYGFINLTHCLSLNDSLWIVPADSNLTWDKVNLYDNAFSDIVSKTAFNSGLRGLKLSSTSPEFTSEGSFEKCWIQENNGVYLYKKGGSGAVNFGIEPYSEYYASQIAEYLCEDYVAYDLAQYKGSLVSVCKMFTSQNEGFLPFYKLLDSNKTYNYNDIYKICQKYNEEESFCSMIVLDAIIYNTDRHLGNFGFIVDNDTYQIKRFAPIFDHNMSLFSRALDDDLVNFEKYSSDINLGHKMGGDFVEIAEKMLTPSIKEKLEKLDEDFSKTGLIRHKQYNLPEERLSLIEDKIRDSIKCLLQSRKIIIGNKR